MDNHHKSVIKVGILLVCYIPSLLMLTLWDRQTQIKVIIHKMSAVIHTQTWNITHEFLWSTFMIIVVFLSLKSHLCAG